MSKLRRKNLRELLNREDYWMGMAFMASASSRNPGRQQGAVVVGPMGNLLALGCDSPPRCMPESEFFRSAERAVIQDSRPCHLGGGTIYLTHTPCPDGMLDVISAEIKRVVYCRTKQIEPASQEMAQQAYVQIVEYVGSVGWVRDHVLSLKSAGVFL